MFSDPLASQIASVPCGDCQRAPPAFDAVQALYSYRWPVNNLITGLKYQQHWHLARLFGEAVEAEQARFDSDIDYLVPMPLHTRRLRQRGYNQSIEIARHISRLKDIPMGRHLCRRIRDTRPQTLCPGSERKRNVRGAFIVDGNVKGLRLAIVDDVVTTGSTANELARVFKQAGADHVEVWCVARASGGTG